MTIEEQYQWIDRYETTPGVYIIRNVATGNFYIGRSVAMGARVLDHFIEFASPNPWRQNVILGGTYKRMKQDLDQHGRGSFSLVVYKVEPDEEARNMLERTLIVKVARSDQRHRLYNRMTSYKV